MSTGVILRFHTQDRHIAKRCILDLAERKLATGGCIFDAECYNGTYFEAQAIAELYTDQNLSKQALAYIEEHYAKSVTSVTEIATHAFSEELHRSVRALHDK